MGAQNVSSYTTPTPKARAKETRPKVRAEAKEGEGGRERSPRGLRAASAQAGAPPANPAAGAGVPNQANVPAPAEGQVEQQQAGVPPEPTAQLRPTRACGERSGHTVCVLIALCTGE